jgi:hypothetical protein
VRQRSARSFALHVTDIVKVLRCGVVSFKVQADVLEGCHCAQHKGKKGAPRDDNVQDVFLEEWGLNEEVDERREVDDEYNDVCTR